MSDSDLFENEIRIKNVSAKFSGDSATAHISITGTRAFAHKIYPDLV